jgi:RNA polymerase sigma-70 factor (ECF subfamily)
VVAVEVDLPLGHVASVSAEPIAAAGECALVVAARNGDRAAFGELYGRYGRMVHGILLARVPRHDVDDLVHDVFLQALKRLASLRQPESFGPWLAAITRNRAMDYHRRGQDTCELPADVPGAAHPQAEAVAVLSLIRGLPEAYRETLVLRLVEGLTGPEIAARTGLTPGSVRVNLHRGMQMLRERLSVGARRT